jgi:hypothetical protein
MTDTPPGPIRSSIFSNPGEAGEFQPKQKPVARPSPEELDQIKTSSKFSRREAPNPPAAPLMQTTTESQPSTRRKPMVYRTGRNVTISVKTTAETVEKFYKMAEKLGWKAGETFENAVEGLIKIHGLD